jgi:uncharacterized Zn finger protein (UPF0148 family)
VHEAATPDQQIQAWLWLSGVHETPAQRRACLEAVLQLDPAHTVARQGLARLPADAPDADEAAPEQGASAQGASALKARRLVCPQCGGNLRSDGGKVRCAYCGYQSTLLEAMRRGIVRDDTVDEQDFAITLATDAGHARPQGMRALSCQTCRAEFVLGPGVLSLTCPYCGSSYVAKTEEERALIPPEGVAPFMVDRDAARRAFHGWLDAHHLPRDLKTSGIFGLYLPVWTFDVGGVLHWRRLSSGGLGGGSEPQLKISLGGGLRLEMDDPTFSEQMDSGELPIDFDDLLVAASHTLPMDLLDVLADYDLAAVAPYRPGYLADQPAEIYEISVSEASLVAREKAFQASRRQLRARMQVGQDVRLDSSRMMIYAYKLILLPLWVTHYRIEETSYHVVINGQTGTVRGQTPPGGLRKFFKGLLG